MRWETPVTVSAQIVLRGSGHWPYLRFAPPLEFRADPNDPNFTADIKNVRYVPLVGVSLPFDNPARCFSAPASAKILTARCCKLFKGLKEEVAHASLSVPA